MENEDLSKLKIDKSRVVIGTRKKRKLVYWVLLIVAVLVLGFLYIMGVFTPAIQVQVATVSQVYPSQAFTMLNASGYVVAQRKSALASKDRTPYLAGRRRGKLCKKGPGSGTP